MLAREDCGDSPQGTSTTDFALTHFFTFTSKTYGTLRRMDGRRSSAGLGGLAPTAVQIHVASLPFSYVMHLHHEATIELASHGMVLCVSSIV